MKQLLTTACAVVLLGGTAFAQTPAAKDKTAPGATPNMAAPAKPSNTPATNQAGSGTTTQAAPNKDADKGKALSGTTAAKPADGAPVTFYTVKPADVRASTLIGSTVYNVNNESIGDIEDIVLEDGKIVRAVVIGVGGFLGMGEHDVAVETEALLITRNTDNENVRIVLNTTKDDLKNAPAVKFDKKSRDQAASSGMSKPAMSNADTPKPAGTTGAGTSDMKSGSADAMNRPDNANKAGGMTQPNMDKTGDGMGKSK